MAEANKIVKLAKDRLNGFASNWRIYFFRFSCFWAILATYLTLIIINVSVIYLRFPRAGTFVPLTFADQKELVRIASGARTEDRNTRDLSMEQRLNVFLCPGSFRNSRPHVTMQDFMAWPSICKVPPNGLMNPVEALLESPNQKRILVSLYEKKDDKTAIAKFYLDNANRKWNSVLLAPESTESSQSIDQSATVFRIALFCDEHESSKHAATTIKAILAASASFLSDARRPILKLDDSSDVCCKQLVGRTAKIWDEALNGKYPALTTKQPGKEHFTATVKLSVETRSEDQLVLSFKPGLPEPTEAFSEIVQNLNDKPVAKILRSIVQSYSSNADETVGTNEVFSKQNDIDSKKQRKAVSKYLSYWNGNAKQFDLESLSSRTIGFPFTGTVSMGNGFESTSLVWFDKTREENRFVVELRWEGNRCTTQRLVAKFYLIQNDGHPIVPEPNIEPILFWNAPCWLGWRPCGYDMTSEQAASQFFTLYERVARSLDGNRKGDESFKSAKPEEMEQVKRWIEAVVQDQLWRYKHHHDGKELDPLKSERIESFTSFSRRINGSDAWGLIQVGIIYMFWFAAIGSLSMSSKTITPPILRVLKGRNVYALEGMPLLGFLGTVVGISNALIGAGGILSESIVLKQRVVSEMTRQLATAFDTTFVGLCGSILLLLIIKIRHI